MNKQDHKQQLIFTKKELISCNSDEDKEKLISNLIYNAQLYEREGGRKDLW